MKASPAKSGPENSTFRALSGERVRLSLLIPGIVFMLCIRPFPGIQIIRGWGVLKEGASVFTFRHCVWLAVHLDSPSVS